MTTIFKFWRIRLQKGRSKRLWYFEFIPDITQNKLMVASVTVWGFSIVYLGTAWYYD